ncbi:SDR family oxidoreductase [Streptosporangium lutulentum]
MKILVTGATGVVGRHVVDRLVGAGVSVRALTRNPVAAGLPPQVEVVEGDLTAPQSVADALRGVERMYLFSVEQTAREIVTLAAQAGVRRVVVLSAASVTAACTPTRWSERSRNPGWNGPTYGPADSWRTCRRSGRRPSGPSAWCATRSRTSR